MIEYTELLEQNLTRLQSSRFRMIDKRVKRLIALIYTVKKTIINTKDFWQTMNQLKQESDFFTLLDANTRAIFSVFLHINDRVDSRDIQQLFIDYKSLKNLGYYDAYGTLFTSLILQVNSQEVKRDMVIQRGIRIYKQIKKAHPFFKGEEIGPASIFLALHPNLAEKTTTEILHVNEFYFEELKKVGYRKNDALQLAAATATCWQAKEDSQLVTSVGDVLTQLRETSIELGPLLYSTLVILACKNLVSPLHMKNNLSYFLTAVHTQNNHSYQMEYNNELALSLYLRSISKE